MFNDKILTISIAAYNIQNYIDDCVSSLLCSDLLNKIEIIIVDDGSKDRTSKIAQSYVDKYPNSVKLISKKNGGYGSTINASLAIAQGRFFKQLDGDDYLITDNIPEYLRILNSTTADVVYTVGEYRYEDKSPTRYYDCHLKPRDTMYVPHDVADHINLQLHCATFRTSMLRKANINLPEHCMYTDLPLSLLGFCNAQTVLSIPLHLYCSRIGRPGQTVSDDGYRKYIDDHIQVTELIAGIRLSDSHLNDLVDRTVGGMYEHSMQILLSMDSSKKTKIRISSLEKTLQEIRPNAFKTIKKWTLPWWMHITNGCGFGVLHVYKLLKLDLKRILKRS